MTHRSEKGHLKGGLSGGLFRPEGEPSSAEPCGLAALKHGKRPHLPDPTREDARPAGVLREEGPSGSSGVGSALGLGGPRGQPPSKGEVCPTGALNSYVRK